VINKILEYGVVCPSIVEKGVFTTSAVVNTDHNPPWTTAMISFLKKQGSVFQQPIEMSTI
jgi:hypothetical protein